MAGKQKKQKSGGGARKVGRTEINCRYYETSMRREKNKEKKLKRHCLSYPKDLCAAAALANVWTRRRINATK